jgi:hypothetical protein
MYKAGATRIDWPRLHDVRETADDKRDALHISFGRYGSCYTPVKEGRRIRFRGFVARAMLCMHACMHCEELN